MLSASFLSELDSARRAALEQPVSYTCLFVYKKLKPGRVLAIELEAILDFTASRDAGEVCLKNPRKLLELLEYAKNHDCMIVMMTSLSKEIDRMREKVSPFLSIKKVIKTIGKEYFNAIYFTNGKPKKQALMSMYLKWFASAQLDPKNAIYFVDNRLMNIQDSPFFREIFLEQKTSDWGKVLAHLDGSFIEAHDTTSILTRLHHPVPRRVGSIPLLLMLESDDSSDELSEIKLEQKVSDPDESISSRDSSPGCGFYPRLDQRVRTKNDFRCYSDFKIR